MDDIGLADCTKQAEAAGMSGAIGGSINSAVRERDPYEIGNALQQLAEKYAAPSYEHQLLMNAVILIGGLLSEKHRAGSRAVAAEAERDRSDARVKLARLALG